MFQSTVTAVSSSAGSLVAGHRVRSVLQVRGCTVLYCTVLYCTVLYCTVLYCTVLYCTVLYCNVRLSCECGCWTAINRSLIRALSRLPGCGWWRGRYYTPDHILSAARHINVNWSQAGNTNLQYSIFHYNTGLLTTGGSPVPHAK